ncbi:unnamed protein product [Bursaphelenchus xylophilus]|uniref:(pine wood nematode) hypothetical protein n=1 Tax=Bursaphelenchus xylophilus TaxID=6326 RepID=A0A1I7RQK7_BURXY|nr:unnamed protein product [Bursaphelenchus xylophilus]CAG9104747.1 unnamed protein product [Bursaphelenchus xylophilus]
MASGNGSPRSSGDYEVSAEELVDLMSLRGVEAKTHIDTEFGGISGLCRKLRTDPFQGILSNECELLKRQELYGKNRLPAGNAPEFGQALKETALSLRPIILGMAAIGSTAACSSYFVNNRRMVRAAEAATLVVIFAAVVVFVGAFVRFQKLRKQYVIDESAKKKSWAELFSSQCQCIRNGKQTKVDAQELVCGDVMEIGKGDRLPVDGVLLQAWDLRVDETNLNKHLDKQIVLRKSRDQDPLLFAGTQVVEGNAKVLVTAVGGRIQLERPDPSPPATPSPR